MLFLKLVLMALLKITFLKYYLLIQKKTISFVAIGMLQPLYKESAEQFITARLIFVILP